MQDFEELFALAERLKKAQQLALADSLAGPLDALESAAQQIGKAFSGSWLGYHSLVYYDGFAPPPPGANFSQEWGLGGDEWLELGSKGRWVQYDHSTIRQACTMRAGTSDFEALRQLEAPVLAEFETCKADLASILATELDARPDTYLLSLSDQLKDLRPISRFDVIEQLRPKRQVMTRDTLALGQGTKVPPHIEILADVLSMRHSAGICAAAAKIAASAGSHIERKARKLRTAERIGTNVFIGHGRSGAWRELKDFVQDRLKLPWDEFNRVPVAGITNTARLSEMLDAASIAFLVMTAEDEMADGGLQARMNVVHEAGLFQGRLGFTRAIVLLEEGCNEFSNIQGLGQIRFPKGNIKASFEEVRLVLEREEIVSLK